jgi:hypothetical protein
MPVQVLPEHYDFERYDHLRRWDSYWHQIRAAMRTGARSVLEIGGGTGVFRSYLERSGITVRSVDIDPSRQPDYVADVSALDEALPAGLRFDCVAAFQVLEHLPHERFDACLAGLARRAAPWCLISLPYHGLQLGLSINVGGKQLRLGTSVPYPRRYRFNGEHHWELGWQHPIRAVTREISAHFEVVDQGFIAEHPYHYLWALRSRSA